MTQEEQGAQEQERAWVTGSLQQSDWEPLSAALPAGSTKRACSGKPAAVVYSWPQVPVTVPQELPEA